MRYRSLIFLVNMVQIFSVYPMEKVAPTKEKVVSHCDPVDSEQLYSIFMHAYKQNDMKGLQAFFELCSHLDPIITKQVIGQIPLNCFVTISKLLQGNDFIAYLVALKIDLLCKRDSSRLADNEKSIIDECLSSFARHISTLNCQKFPDSQPFYNVLDCHNQKVLKDLLIKRYIFPTRLDIVGTNNSVFNLPAEELAPFCWAERAPNPDKEIYIFNKEDRINAFKLVRRIKNAIFDDDWSRYAQGCMKRISLGDYHDWIAIGNKEGRVRISSLNRLKNIQINPLGVWGAVCALCAYNGVLVVAYKSGAIEMFHLSKFKNVTENAQQANGPDMIISCTSCDGEGRDELASALAKNEASSEKKICTALTMNDTYVIAAYQDFCIKTWKDKKLHSQISLPQNLEKEGRIEVLHILSNNRVALGCSDGSVYALDIEKASVVRALVNSGVIPNPVIGISALGKEDQYLAVVHKNGPVYVWDLKVKTDKPLRIISGKSYPLGASSLQDNKAILEIIYENASISYVFIPEIAQLGELISVLKSKNITRIP